VRAKLARQRRPERIAMVTMRPKRAPGDCSDCHRDPHQGQFAAQTMAGDDCAACHTTESFAKVRFDHNRDSRFPLTGAHSKAPCASCHKREPIRAGGPEAIRYKPVATFCTDARRTQAVLRKYASGAGGMSRRRG